MTGSKQMADCVCWAIRVRGTVQGVGFRPTVYNLARRFGLKGHVLNDGEGVYIEAWGAGEVLGRFLQALRDEAPPLSVIEEIDTEEVAAATGDQACLNLPNDFMIAGSNQTNVTTRIAADAATCAACLDDVISPFSRRYRYPFTNCTHCGPRLSIIRSIPYDRANTCMAPFKMCDQCQTEYDHPDDRRYHAQPNACHSCGPKAELVRADGRALCIETFTQLDSVDAAANLIKKGEIVAVKGIGGFHIACDATNENAVAKLRSRKRRFDKPFALMARDADVIRRYCPLSESEEALLKSAAAPIVLISNNRNSPARNEDNGANSGLSSPSIAPSVAPRQNCLGFMLPYTPLHHLLMRRVEKPIVLTSGNLTDEPQCIDNTECRERLGEIADYILLHDREIVNREDDSVVRVSGERTVMIRRARGYAPAPLPLPKGFEQTPELLAMGSELKNTFCLVKDSRAILSQHIGDLEDVRTNLDYQRCLELFGNLFQHEPQRIAVDLHPDYISSKIGRARAEQDRLPLDEIQHHHAHIASCLADNGWPLERGKVLGVALDGLGYGADGTFWGGEFLLCDYFGYERVGTFKPVRMPGGAQSIREPWRNTYAHIQAQMGWSRYLLEYDALELTKFLQGKPLTTLDSMLVSGFQAPLSSSCGRLFDAVAAAAGICRESISFEGQAAIELEAAIDLHALRNEPASLDYPFTIPRLPESGLPYVEPLAVWHAIFGDLLLGTDAGTISARFHKGLARAIIQMVCKLTTRDEERWLDTVALSGGVFQNKILSELVEEKLSALGYQVLTHSKVPANDGGLSLGQAAISAASHMAAAHQA